MRRIGVFTASESNGSARSDLARSVWKSVVALVGAGIFAIAAVFALTAVLAIACVALLGMAIWWRVAGKKKLGAKQFSRAPQEERTQRRGHTIEGQIVPQKDESN
jgi:uncharacterized oligopeptide transporter (OPT) family protein